MVIYMTVKKYHYIAFLFILIFGTAMHFAYSFFCQNPLIAYFVPVNESPWEHLKLLFFPAVTFSVFEYFVYGKTRKDFWAIKMTALVFSMLFILVFFYTYSGILGFYLLPLDILDFVIADFLYCFISYKMYNNICVGSVSDSIKGIAVIVLIALCFVIWTNNPPDLGLFWG